MPISIVVRSRKWPYIVFSVLLGPIIALSMFAAIRSGMPGNFGTTALLAFMLSLIFCYLLSLKLVLAADRVIYRCMWSSREILVNEIQAVERRRGPFGAGMLWVIRRSDHAESIFVNITNFDPQALGKFANALLDKNADIRFL